MKKTPQEKQQINAAYGDFVDYSGVKLNPEIHVAVGQIDSRKLHEIYPEINDGVREEVKQALLGMTGVQAMFELAKQGRAFRSRLPEEINPKPQPTRYELEEIYGSVNNTLGAPSLDTVRKFYQIFMLEC